MVIDPHLLAALEQSIELLGSSTSLWSTDCERIRELFLLLQAAIQPQQKDGILLSRSEITLVYLSTQSAKIAGQIQALKALTDIRAVDRKRKEIAAAGRQLLAEVNAITPERVGERTRARLYLVGVNEEDEPCR